MCTPNKKILADQKIPACLISRIKQAVRGKKASFKNWSSNPTEEIRTEHNYWQVECESVMRQAKKEFEEQLAKGTKTNSKLFF